MIISTHKILLSTLVAAALTACGGDGGSTNNGYSAEDTKVAIEQCTQSGAPQAMCECVTKELQVKISADEMKKIEADMQAGKAMNEDFVKASTDAGVKCMQAPS